MWIDSHQHFWLMRNRIGQWPPPELAKIHRDFLPADLEPTLRACGVKGTVLVQSLPTMADTDFMLGLADRHPFIVGARSCNRSHAGLRAPLRRIGDAATS
jgi:L-fuconolactonase